MKILTIIPARSGSKGVPNKNIKKFRDKPLLAWSIEQAKQTEYYKNMKIIVSTDSEKYKEIALKWGAEVPFLRPKELSEDLSTDYEFINHALNWLKTNQTYVPDIILHLRPTQPHRKIEDINKCLKIFIENINDFDSLRTVIPFEKSPYKMYVINENKLEPLFNQVNSIKEPFNQCRQKLPQTYLHNGYIDIYKTSVIKNGILSGEKIYPYIMSKNDTIDIDTEEDWKKAELFLS
jgi:CMP-N,N'-diacetyllegionaminic acid synthase